jgi:hypothetical protein
MIFGGHHLPLIGAIWQGRPRTMRGATEGLVEVAGPVSRPRSRSRRGDQPRSISATRNASSSDCWVFSRGSQAVS